MADIFLISGFACSMFLPGRLNLSLSHLLSMCFCNDSYSAGGGKKRKFHSQLLECVHHISYRETSLNTCSGWNTWSIVSGNTIPHALPQIMLMATCLLFPTLHFICYESRHTCQLGETFLPGSEPCNRKRSGSYHQRKTVLVSASQSVF